MLAQRQAFSGFLHINYLSESPYLEEE